MALRLERSRKIKLRNTVLDRCSTVVAALGALFVVGVSLLQMGVTLGLLDFGARTGRISSPYNLTLLLIGYAGFVVWIAAPFALVIYLAKSNKWARWAKASLLAVAVCIGALSYHLVVNLLGGPFVIREKGGVAIAILPFVQFSVVFALVGLVSLVRGATNKKQ